MTTPAFAGYINDRMWNGTIYYDDPHAFDPRVIIRANGSTQDLKVWDFENVQVDIQVDAFSGAGRKCEIWVLMQSKFGKFTYDGAGPHAGWWRDVSHPYFQGLLADLTDTVLNQALPTGNYSFFLALDRVPDGVPNKADILTLTSVNVRVDPFSETPMTENFDDGVADNWIDDGPHWSVPVDTYFLDCPSYARFVSYYDGSAYTDFTYTADLLQVATGNPSMSYDFGMIFRSDGTLNNCYDFYAEPDGTVYLWVRPGSTLYSNTLSTNWITGHNVWNTVSVDVRGDVIDLYINGVLETTVSDSTHTWGFVGLTGQGSGTYDQDFHFDNVSVTL
jgi:hypothetical protein